MNAMEGLVDAWKRGRAVLPGAFPATPHDRMADVASSVPIFAVDARGSRLRDSLGREYLDTTMAWGAVLLGHSDEEVARAVAEQATRGTLSCCQTELQVEVAERLCRMIPCAEQVLFCKNGSDACTAAVRLARAVTGRELVALCPGHYHGFHDWSVARYPRVEGIPEALRKGFVEFPYNDAAALARLMERKGRNIAAIMLEPVREADPREGYLREVVAIARRHGALVVFDEMVTGFRLGPGGAQQLHGVAPDLACFGKSMANGLPLACLAGRRSLMERTPAVSVSMTCQFEQLSLAAARVVLGRVAEPGFAEGLAAFGERIRDGLRLAAADRGVPICVMGPSARTSFWLPAEHGEGVKDRMNLFIEELMVRGVLANGNVLPSASHTPADAEELLAAAAPALAAVADAARRGELRSRRRADFEFL